MANGLNRNSRSAGPFSQALKQGGWLLAVSLLLAIGNWMFGSTHLALMADPAVYELELAVPVVEIPAALELFDEGRHFNPPGYCLGAAAAALNLTKVAIDFCLSNWMRISLSIASEAFQSRPSFPEKQGGKAEQK